MSNTDTIPFAVKKAFDDAQQYFPSPVQQFQFFDKYSRFNYDKGRRETWIETVDRSMDFLKKVSKNRLPDIEYERIRNAILKMEASPSMRLLAMAGPAAERDNASIYNCSYLPLDSIDSLVEELFIAMAGTGVGYSVERKHVEKLPDVKPVIPGQIPTPHIIDDSTEGWAAAFRFGLESWFNGKTVRFDYSQVRDAGKPLKIKGGRASGPGPLRNLLEFTKNVILKRQGQKLRPVDVHDIACKVGEAIVSGGVRRTALIALFDADDVEMLNCKNGDNIVGNEQRWMANNSAVWNKEVTQEQVLTQMYEMMKGMRGEPGIFSRHNANSLMPERRARFGYQEYGTNPCGEINLRPYEFCNLSIAIAREDDTLETLKEKVEIATIIGTIQSMATHFPYLRPIWKKNCDEERLLGVDITGQMDCPLLRPTNPLAAIVFEKLKEHAIEINKKYAALLGIPQSASVTCVKPSGNSSQLFNCASGLHPRWAPYYIRNIRVQAHSPLRKLLQEQGVPMDPENNQTEENATAYVIHFPVSSPKGAITRKDMNALDQCEHWLRNKLYWTEHNPSVTIMYHKDEIIDLIKWVWDHKEFVGGMSFLPRDDADYPQMPYIEITEQEYQKLISEFPLVDFSRLWVYEKEDFTTAAQELACSSKDGCEIDYTSNSFIMT